MDRFTRQLLGSKSQGDVVPNGFKQPRSHFYNSTIRNYWEQGGSLAPIIPHPYKSKGIPIYRDTTDSFLFENGGELLAQPYPNSFFASSLENYYADGGPLHDRDNETGKLLNSTYASALGRMFREGGSVNPPKRKNYNPIYTNDPNDPRIQNYRDSLKLYYQGLNEKNAYTRYLYKNNFDVKNHLAKWSTDGYVDTSKHPTIGATHYGILENSGGGYDRKPDGTARFFTYYPKASGVEEKVYDDTKKGKILKERFSVYKKPVQPVYYKKAEDSTPKLNFNDKPEIPITLEPIVQEPIQVENTPLIQMPLKDKMVLSLGRSYSNESSTGSLKGGKTTYGQFEKVVDPKSGKIRYIPTGKKSNFITLEDPTFKQGGTLFRDGGYFDHGYSLPEDSFRQGHKGLKDSIYASTSGQYPAPYKYGGSILSMSNTPQLEGEGKDLNYPSKGYAYGNGGMLKRADGSYSKRGLWDNIRANRGSGKKPTKEMLAQERKIRNKKRQGGAITTSQLFNQANFFEDGGYGDPPSKLITYKNDAKLIDGTAAFDLISKVPISADYNQQIKERLYTGKWGFDPNSGALVKLNKSQQATIPKETEKILLQQKNTQTKKEQNKEYLNSIKKAGYDPETFAGGYLPNSPEFSQYVKRTTPRTFEELKHSNPDTWTQEEKDIWSREGFSAVVNNPVFQTAAYFTPPGMAIGAIQGAANLIPDLYEGDYGAAAIDAASMLPFARPIAKNVAANTSKIYNKVATGNSPIPVAWKMEKPVAKSLESQLKNLRGLTDDEARVVNNYLESPYHIKTSPEDSKILDKIVRENYANLSETNQPITRINDYYVSQEGRSAIPTGYGESFSFPRGRSWSLGQGVTEGFDNTGKVRLVIPSRYSKGLNQNFHAVDYSDPRLTQGIGRQGEKELFGNVPEGFKVIGKSNEGGFENIFVKPKVSTGYKEIPKPQSVSNSSIKLLPDDIRSKELNMETFGVYKGNTKVGEVAGNRLSNGDFETLDIGIDPKFQRQGIGTEVYKQLNQSLPQGNKVKSWGAFVENEGIAPGRNTWQSLERKGLARQNEKGIYEMLPEPVTTTPIKSGLGNMDMSRYEIKNPDYYSQLLDTYTSRVLPSSSKKFYKSLIETVKKQNGLVTEKQLNELDRLKTGNFDFGKRGYNYPNQPTEFQKAGFDGNLITRPLTPFSSNELTAGNQWYRKIGNEAGLKDLINQQGAKAPAPMKMKSGIMLDAPFFGRGASPTESYKGLYTVEVKPEAASKYNWRSRVAGVDNYGSVPFENDKLVSNFPLEDLNVYRKKWFSNNYKQLDPTNLEQGLNNAALQRNLENVYKWGVRGYLGKSGYDYVNTPNEEKKYGGEMHNASVITSSKLFNRY